MSGGAEFLPSTIMNEYTVNFPVFARGQVVKIVQVAEASNPLVPTGHPAGFGLDFALDESITQLAQRILLGFLKTTNQPVGHLKWW